MITAEILERADLEQALEPVRELRLHADELRALAPLTQLPRTRAVLSALAQEYEDEATLEERRIRAAWHRGARSPARTRHG
ncbi:MAG: hypothetical protein ACM30I_10855 [Gemmatimonas sp.]